MSLAEKLAALKDQFADHLCTPELLKQPEGVPTGLESLDRFLVSNGIPKGGISLFNGAIGTGATSLWLEAAARVVSAGRWVSWVNGETPLLPVTLQQKGIDLTRFISIETPDSDEKLFWSLQEMMSTGLFGLIGCDLGARTLKEHQLRKLQAQARDSHMALVFVSQTRGRVGASSGPALITSRQRKMRGSIASVYSLILNFEKKQIVVERALHRPTPHILVRSVSYARFTQHLGSAATSNVRAIASADGKD